MSGDWRSTLQQLIYNGESKMDDQNKNPEAKDGETAWQKERREALKREEDTHNARMRDVEDVIRHRAAVEAMDKERNEAFKSEFANIQAHRDDTTKLHERSVAAAERSAHALELLVKLLIEDKSRR